MVINKKISMKQDIAAYLVDSFTDFLGKEHKIVSCALSHSPGSNVTIKTMHGPEEFIACSEKAVYRTVAIGIAICNPTDTFNVEVGKRIAYHKAVNKPNIPKIYVTDKGIITKELVETFLKQQVRFCKENPELLIPGYDQARTAHEQNIALRKEVENLTPDEKVIFDLAVSGFDFSKYIKLAKSLKA